MEKFAIKVESDIIEDYMSAHDEKMGVKVMGGWLERDKAIEFARALLTQLLNDEIDTMEAKADKEAEKLAETQRVEDAKHREFVEDAVADCIADEIHDGDDGEMSARRIMGAIRDDMLPYVSINY